MYKAYRFRMYPNIKQKDLIHKNFGCVRFVYNHYLEKSKKNEFEGAFTYCNELKILVKENDIIVSENLKVTGMLKNRLFSKNIIDANFNKITNYIKWK